MGYGIARTARSRKAKAGLRALLGKAPSAAAVGDRLVRLARRMLRGQVVDATPRRVTVQLHPFASPARIVVRPDGDLEFAAETLALGPGYHVDAMARFTALVDELDFQWVGDDPDPKLGMLAAVAELLRGDGPVALGMPAERTFVVDAPVLTALGPRDAAWRASPERWPDAFAWWDTGPGQRARADALLAMWHELPWRAPLDDDERAAMARVAALLATARAADPAIPLPMAAW
ncbi:MAG: hypothetical protein NT062_28165, partial [Proteobacteria bacterium]|nr:hypothetical protein [Pseudomonadota bacterium]